MMLISIDTKTKCQSSFQKSHENKSPNLQLSFSSFTSSIPSLSLTSRPPYSILLHPTFVCSVVLVFSHFVHHKISLDLTFKLRVNQSSILFIMSCSPFPYSRYIPFASLLFPHPFFFLVCCSDQSVVPFDHGK